MAYLAELSSLVDELVTSITCIPPSDPRFNIHRETSLRNLRHHSNLRTNQFDVQEQLNGWQERFRVHGRERLADALHSRLRALESQSTRWKPDILHFLLQLADQPTQKTDLSDLNPVIDELEDGPKLTWNDIAKEDGWLEDRALWRTINYADSSDDDDDEGAYEDTKSESSVDSASTSPSSTDRYQRTVEDLVISVNGDAELHNIIECQAWRCSVPILAENGRPKKTAISDIQVFREVLFMLGGHPTSIFDESDEPVLKYQMSDVAWGSYKAVVTTYAEWGKTLKPLRDFYTSKQRLPLIQVFQDAIGKRLLSFERELSGIEARYVTPKEDAVVSLISIADELRPPMESLSALSGIVQQLVQGLYPHPFQYLELLYEAAGVAQAVGTSDVYRFLASIFLECFQVYLRPIRVWMEEGRLLENDKTFFISQSSTKVHLKDIWNGQFKLRQTQVGVLHAPSFLHPAAKRIFTTGKSVNVLKRMGRYDSTKAQWTGQEPSLDFATICKKNLELCPFSDLFSEAFDRWIHSKHHATSATLRKVLFESCNLSSALDSLQHIYFGADASALDGFADPLFRHLDLLSPSWKDRFTLTETAQEAFSRYVDSHRLAAHVDPKLAVRSDLPARSSVRHSLPAVRLTYRLNWPVQLILLESSLSAYQSIFTLLLQLRRGISVLNRLWTTRAATNISSSSHMVDNHGVYCLVRTKLLWFCNTLSTYLTNLVLAANIALMKDALRDAVDVDDMIAVHTAFASSTLEECCLGAKLEPLKECILDILDLAIRLEDAHRAAVVKEVEHQQEMSRLSGVDTKPRGSRSGVYVKPKDDEEDDSDEDADEVLNRSVMGGQTKSYGETLTRINAEFEKHLRFVSGGLRGVARATRSKKAAGKWDMLAEMLEFGIGEAEKAGF